MRTNIGRVLMQTMVVAVLMRAETQGQEFFYDQDRTYSIACSELRISVQLDSLAASVKTGSFFAAHPCLDTSIQVAYLARGYWTYGLQPSWTYTAAAADLLGDPVVRRVVPVYVTGSDSVEFKVTDVVAVQFNNDLNVSTMDDLLAANGLVFLDSSNYMHNLWHCDLVPFSLTPR